MKYTYRWLSGKESTCQWRKHGFYSWVHKFPWSKSWQAASIFFFFCSTILAWKIPWTEEPGSLQSMELQGVRHNWATEHARMQGEILIIWCFWGNQYHLYKRFPNHSESSNFKLLWKALIWYLWGQIIWLLFSVKQLLINVANNQISLKMYSCKFY